MVTKAQTIRVYDLDNVKGKDYMTISESRVQDHLPAEMEHNEDGKSDDVVKLLHTNPFLYYPSSDVPFIPSIEEFYVDVNNSKMSMGALIRGNKYSKVKKKKILKKNFKNWYSDFIGTKNRILTMEGSDEAQKAYIFNKISWYVFPILVILFIIVTFIGFQTGQAWTMMETKKFYPKVELAFSQINSHSWFKIVTNVTLTLIVCGFVYGLMYNKLLNDNRKLNLYRSKLFDKANLVIKKDFKDKFRYTKKYYLKNVGKKDRKFPPLAIHKTVPTKVNLKLIEEFTDGYKEKTANLKNKKTILSILKYMTVYLSISGSVFIIVYAMYFIVKNIL